MDIAEALLDSWDRQCRIVNAVASLIDEANRQVKPSDDGWGLDQHLAHMHGVRKYFLSQIAPEHAAGLVSASADKEGTPLADLDAIKACLKASAAAVRAAVKEGLEKRGSGRVKDVTSSGRSPSPSVRRLTDPSRGGEGLGLGGETSADLDGYVEELEPMAGEHVVYDNPIPFLQHMVWHDGWHVGLIFLALRLNGQEPPEEWEEPNVWGQWRTETW